MPKPQRLGFTLWENYLTFNEMNPSKIHPTVLTVAVLVLPESSMMSLASTLDPMRVANRLSNDPVFSWKVVTLDNQPVKLSCGMVIPPDTDVENLILEKSGTQKEGLLFVVSSFNQDSYAGKPQLALIRKLTNHFKMVCGVESAPWILARCGLLHHKSATTHWEDLEDFELAFPEINVKADRFVIDGDIVTTGGASPTLDFILYLIRTRCGEPLALSVSSIFIYQGDRPSDFLQYHSLGFLKNKEPRVAKAIELMEEYIDEPISVQKIADAVNISLRQMENLFSYSLGVSPGAYYRYLRLHTARRLVVDTNLDIQEVMLRTGFSSLSAFSRSFKQYFSHSPLKLRKINRN